MDVSHYLAHAMRQRKVVFYHLPLKVALHPPCTLRQGEGQEEAVVELLQKIPGLEILPLSGEPRCCSAGGDRYCAAAPRAAHLSSNGRGIRRRQEFMV